jgi:hypothetical protein
MKFKYPTSIMIAAVVMVTVTIVLAGGCRTRKESSETNILIGEYITGYTSGQVARSAQLVIKFARPAVEPGKAGSQADEKVFAIKPSVEGVLSWADESTLTFTPVEKLSWGTEYTITVDIQMIFGKDARVREHVFTVFTPDKNFAVDVSGLQMTDGDNTTYRLAGEITTSDEFEAKEVEQIIVAVQDGNELDIDWDHRPDERKHIFTVRGIERTEEEGELLIK